MTFDVTGAIEVFQVPQGVSEITILARGAAGGASSPKRGGRGALIQGTFAVTPLSTLQVLVGSKADDWTSGGAGAGGGGGSFVAIGDTPATAIPLLVAGGGGGAGRGDNAWGGDGGDAGAAIAPAGAAGGQGGGDGGQGGAGGDGNWGNATQGAGGGGGSLNHGTNQQNTAGANDGDGQVQICYIPAVLPYDFRGFFPPVDNPSTLNMVKAGSAIPVKFSLAGDQGLDIFASEAPPTSQRLVCDSGALIDEIKQTVTAGASGLYYDSGSDTYIYVWKTDKAWAGTCRQLILTLDDGTTHRANFKFK